MTFWQIMEFYREKGIKKESTLKTLAESTQFKKRKKGDRLRTAGEPMKTVMFHLNGVGRVYVIDEHGRENIMGFCYEPGGPCLGASGVQETYSLNIDAATDMDTLELSTATLMHLSKKDPDISEVIQRLMREDHDKDYRWQIATKTKFGEERYQWFLEEYADIVGVVTQKDVASFLGLRPQSLSRIKVALEKEAEAQ